MINVQTYWRTCGACSNSTLMRSQSRKRSARRKWQDRILTLRTILHTWETICLIKRRRHSRCCLARSFSCSRNWLVPALSTKSTPPRSLLSKPADLPCTCMRHTLGIYASMTSSLRIPSSARSNVWSFQSLNPSLEMILTKLWWLPIQRHYRCLPIMGNLACKASSPQVECPVLWACLEPLRARMALQIET